MRRTMLVAGLVLLAVAALWNPVAVPRLVRFPAGVDETTSYTGTFTLHVDPATAQPLDAPMRLPLEIERRVHTVPGGGADTAVVEEAVTYRIGGTAQRERHRYVIDRRSMQNRDDDRSWSFSPDNPIHQGGTYRVTLPVGTEADGRYRIWENEPGRSYWMVPDPSLPRAHQNGLDLIGLQEVWQGAPVAPYYHDELRKQGFALDLAFASLAERLGADGVDVDAGLGALPAADGPIVAAAREARLPLRFFRDNDGHALVEPRTGMIVDLVRSEEAITATLDLEPLRELRQALDRVASPDAAALADALDELDRAGPSPMYSLAYGQTETSVAATAARARSERRKLDLVERYVPAALAAIGVALVIPAGVASWHRRRARRQVTPPAGAHPGSAGWRALRPRPG